MFYVHHVGVVIERNFVYLIIHSYILAQTSSRFYIYILEEKVDQLILILSFNYILIKSYPLCQRLNLSSTGGHHSKKVDIGGVPEVRPKQQHSTVLSFFLKKKIIIVWEFDSIPFFFFFFFIQKNQVIPKHFHRASARMPHRSLYTLSI